LKSSRSFFSFVFFESRFDFGSFACKDNTKLLYPIVAIFILTISTSLFFTMNSISRTYADASNSIYDDILNPFPQIQSVGNKTLIVWQDNSTGNNEIYLTMSTDGGNTFEATKNLSNSTGSSQFPQIQSVGNKTLIVWQDNSTGNNEIYLRKSNNEGSTFSSKKNLSNSTGSSQFPQIQSVGNKTLIVWQDNSTGNNELNLKVSTDGGNTFVYPENIIKPNLQSSEPTVNDSSLRVEQVATGIAFPTQMDFLGNSDILVLEKNAGEVKRVANGTLQNNSLLDVPVANSVERGMLGIAVQRIPNGPTFVFLYFTESVKDGDDKSEKRLPIGNRLYRYELVQDKLVNPKLLLDLPATPGPAHNGGKLIVGPDGNLYLTIGDLNPNNSRAKNATFSQAQNHAEGLKADGRGGILRIMTTGNTVKGGILGSQSPLNEYFAHGIRNSFGIDFDPVTGFLWDTENGPQFGDEINLVLPGFNSGWNRVQGVWEPNGPLPGNFTNKPEGLVDFNGTSKYRSPEFTWFQPPPGLTGIKFLNSDKLGKKYKDDLFVGDFHNGNIYHFKLNHTRTGLQLNSVLQDKIANSPAETQGIIFAHGFGGITDLAVGPDGYLYVLSLYQGGNDCDTTKYQSPSCISYTTPLQGTIFRIIPKGAVLD
jgi:glucose/arabinose dehydrogenase